MKNSELHDAEVLHHEPCKQLLVGTRVVKLCCQTSMQQHFNPWDVLELSETFFEIYAQLFNTVVYSTWRLNFAFGSSSG